MSKGVRRVANVARARVFGFALVSCAAVLSLPAPSNAAVRGWCEPTLISTTLPSQVDWFPAVAADNFGNVHVIWNKTTYGASKDASYSKAATETSLGQLSYARWNGSSWTPEADLALIWSG